MCQPAPVVDRFGSDVSARFGIPTVYGRPGPGGVYLGSVGDQRHSVSRSSHNCASAPGGQESAVNGVSYHGGYAHAWDCRPATWAIGEELAALALRDDRTRYVIYNNVGRYPDGGTWPTSHPTWHISFLPGTHFNIRPFFAPAAPAAPPVDWAAIADYIQGDHEMLIRLKGNPSVLLAGPVASLVPGPLVQHYAKEGVKVVDLPANATGRRHYKVIRDRAVPIWKRTQKVKVV